jgi:hypothetical protein
VPAEVPQAGAPTTQQSAADPQLAYLANLLNSDPNLRNVIAAYLTTGQTPATPPPSQTAPPVDTSLRAAPSPFEPQFDEYTDPNIRALFERNAHIEQRLQQLADNQRMIDDANHEQQVRHYASIVEGVSSQFGTQYALPPNVLQQVRETAARLGAANSYMNGIHPVTGLPVRPDPAEAVRTALTVAYYATPSAQQLEQTRTLQRAQAAAQHRQKLSGVGGSSASVPRNPPPPTTPTDRHSAMIGEVAEMFNGSWTGGNNN